MPKSTSKSISGRHPIEFLRVRYWFEGIKMQTQCKNAYQIEKRFEPSVSSKSIEQTPFRNKWAKYGKGIITPRKKQIAKFEMLVPGSSRELNHPLWEILKLDDTLIDNSNVWLMKLEPRVQAIVMKKSRHRMNAPIQCKSYSPTLANKLMKYAGLDALAALLLYWLDAKNSGESYSCYTQALTIFKMMLLLGLDMFNRGLVREFFSPINDLVFIKTAWAENWENSHFYIDDDMYLRCIYVLNWTMLCIEDVELDSPWPKRCRIMNDMLSGSYDLPFIKCLTFYALPECDMGKFRQNLSETGKNEWGNWLRDWIMLSLFAGQDRPEDLIMQKMGKEVFEFWR